MPLTDQDARALTYLARRLRDETHGASTWDEAGTYAKIATLIGQNLAIGIERVTRHAADPEAKTPGAILRPFTPPAPEAARVVRDVLPATDRCGICGRGKHAPNDHEFESLALAGRNKLAKDDAAAIVAELRDIAASAKAAPKPTAEPATTDPNPAAAALRAAINTENAKEAS